MNKLFTKVNLFIFVLGVLSFSSVLFVQVPLQSAVANIQGLSIRLQTWAFILILTLIAGFVQQIFKVIPALLAGDKIQGGLISGLAFGLAEAFFLLYPPLRLGTGVSAIAVFERIIAIIFHMSSTGLIMHGLVKKKFLISYFIISIVHGVLDMFAGLYQSSLLNIATVETFATITSLALAAILFVLIKRKKTDTTVAANDESKINNCDFLKHLLNSLEEEIVLVDTNHTIVFVNAFAREKYLSRGFEGNLEGKSLFLCHNENSRQMILSAFEKLVAGSDKVLLSKEGTQETIMKAVRDGEGNLLGYIEIIKSV